MKSKTFLMEYYFLSKAFFIEKGKFNGELIILNFKK